MKKQYSFIAIILFFTVHTFAQSEGNGHSISGIVQDKISGQPIEFASVQLLNPKDSTILKTIVTDRKGKFLFDGVAAGNYLLRYSFIGYEKVLMPITVDQKRENIGIVGISVLSKDMGEV